MNAIVDASEGVDHSGLPSTCLYHVQVTRAAPSDSWSTSHTALYSSRKRNDTFRNGVPLHVHYAVLSPFDPGFALFFRQLQCALITTLSFPTCTLRTPIHPEIYIYKP